MSILGWLLSKRSTIEGQTTLANPDRWMSDLWGNKSKSGIDATPDQALKVSTVYRGVLIKAQSLAMLPLELRSKKGNNGSQVADSHDVTALLDKGLHPERTNYDWFKFMEMCRIFRGNCYAYKVLLNDGTIDQLIPIHPERIRAARTDSGMLYYLLKNRRGVEEVVPAEWIFHHHAGLSPDGITGYSLVERMSEAVGMALATEEHGARQFSNGARIGGILRHKGTFSSTEVAERVRQSFEQATSGLQNAHRTALLEEDMDWTAVGMTNTDSQYMDTRKFTVAEFARWIGLPLHFLGESVAGKATVEQQSLEYLLFGMMPEVTSWQEKLKKEFLSPKERRKLFFRFDLRTLTKADTAGRTAYYANGRQWGYLNADDVRELEDLEPLPDDQGQVYMIPANMIDASKINEQLKPAGQNPAMPGGTDQNGQPMKTPPGQDNNDKQSVQRAKRILIEGAISKLSAREGHALRNLAKKHAKNSNFEAFKADLSAFWGEMRNFTESAFMPAALAIGALNDETELRGIERSRSWADHRVSRRQNAVEKSLIDVDGAEALEQIESWSRKWIEEFEYVSDEFLGACQ